MSLIIATMAIYRGGAEHMSPMRRSHRGETVVWGMFMCLPYFINL